MDEAEAAKYIESLKTASGGWTREDLSSIGIEWPPKKGWKATAIKNLIERAKNIGRPK